MYTTMGRKVGPPCANLSVGFLERTILFLGELPKYLSHGNFKLIDELFQRYMDDGFFPWYFTLDLNILKNVLRNLYPTIESNVEQAKLGTIIKY